MTQTTATEQCEWSVSGMDCGSCSAKVRGAVERLPGVGNVTVALMQEKLSLSLDPTLTARDEIEATVRALGYGIAPVAAAPGKAGGCGSGGACCGHAHHATPASHGHVDTGRDPAWHQTDKGRLVIAIGGLLTMAWAAKLILPPALAHWGFTAACLIALVPVARRAFAAARAGMPFTIEMLMTIAAAGALLIGAAEEAAIVVFLFAVGEVLEGVAANRAREGIRALTRLVPKTALLEENGTTRTVAADSLRVGDMVLVRPGDRIPADGEVVEGVSGVDESPVTGESVPATRGPGDEVFAGSVNTEAALRVAVSRPAADNTIARIIRLVEEAESARAPVDRFIERFSRLYMPAVVGLAVIVAVLPPLVLGEPWQTWIYRALALLLIGCPCALVISVPASIASALSSGARRGLLMKGGAVLEAAARTTRVAFDKTGTLTMGRPQVTDIVPLTADAEEVLRVAAAVENGSSHPLAEAIVTRAREGGIAVLAVRGAKVLPGMGAEAIVGDSLAFVGSPRFATDAGVLDAAQHGAAVDVLEAEGKTTVAVFRQDKLLGLIGLRDEPRADASAAVQQLKALGIAATMLTGDNARTAAAIAKGLGVDHLAELMPEGKVAAIREMASSASVMMVGDGINDAPALALAHVGVAMGSGTDVALETADAAILRNRVTDVPSKIRLARAAMANIRQNIGIALGLKALFLTTTIAGMTGLWIAVMADTGATVLVTLNALRLLAFDPERES